MQDSNENVIIIAVGKSNLDNFFYLYGDENLLKKEVSKNKLLAQHCEIINADNIILDDESPLAAAKKSKESAADGSIPQCSNGDDVERINGHTYRGGSMEREMGEDGRKIGEDGRKNGRWKMEEEAERKKNGRRWKVEEKMEDGRWKPSV